MKTLKKNIWGTEYSLTGRTVNYINDKTSGFFTGYEGIGLSVSDFEGVCYAHYSNVLVENGLA